MQYYRTPLERPVCRRFILLAHRWAGRAGGEDRNARTPEQVRCPVHVAPAGITLATYPQPDFSGLPLIANAASGIWYDPGVYPPLTRPSDPDESFLPPVPVRRRRVDILMPRRAATATPFGPPAWNASGRRRYCSGDATTGWCSAATRQRGGGNFATSSGENIRARRAPAADECAGAPRQRRNSWQLTKSGLRGGRPYL